MLSAQRLFSSVPTEIIVIAFYWNLIKLLILCTFLNTEAILYQTKGIQGPQKIVLLLMNNTERLLANCH